MTIRLMLAAAAVLAAAVPATAADVGLVPPAVAVHNECANTSVLDRIIDRFAWAERNTWRRGFIIEALHNPRPSGHPYAAPGIIERSYCMAALVMTTASSARLLRDRIRRGLCLDRRLRGFLRARPRPLARA